MGMLDKRCLGVTPLLLHSCTCICLCGADYLLFPLVHEAFACAALWTNSAGIITLASQCHPWQKLAPSNGPPHTETLPYACPAFFNNFWPSLLGTFYFAHQILCPQKSWTSSCSVNYVGFSLESSPLALERREE